MFWVVVIVGIFVLNIYIVYNFLFDFWVNFKVFGLMGIIFVCVLVMIIVFFKYLFEDDEKKDFK